MVSKKSHAGMRKPAPLRRGDTVAIVAPSSPIEKELLDAGCKRLETMGYRPLYLPAILDRDLYFAGTAKRRARELEEMFGRDDGVSPAACDDHDGADHIEAGAERISLGDTELDR